MERQMNNKRLRNALIVVFLVLAAVLAAFWATMRLEQFANYQLRHPSSVIPGDFEFFYAANAITSTINIALLVVLTMIYLSIYVKTRSPFTIGLVIFALVFLVKDLTSSPLVISLLGFRAFGLGPFALLPSLFEFVALSILLYLSARY
jgi:hypothetical protein